MAFAAFAGWKRWKPAPPFNLSHYRNFVTGGNRAGINFLGKRKVRFCMRSPHRMLSGPSNHLFGSDALHAPLSMAHVSPKHSYTPHQATAGSFALSSPTIAAGLVGPGRFPVRVATGIFERSSHA